MNRQEDQESEAWRDRIVQTPLVLGGKPRIKDTRVSVELITDLLEGSHTVDDLLIDYPFITVEDIDACRRYKATGAVLSYYTWDDINGSSHAEEKSYGKATGR